MSGDVPPLGREWWVLYSGGKVTVVASALALTESTLPALVARLPPKTSLFLPTALFDLLISSCGHMIGIIKVQGGASSTAANPGHGKSSPRFMVAW
jgi:hypothetical protein